MRYFLDTGILARLPHRTDPLHETVRQGLRVLHADRHTFVTATQNMAEFWNLCTRPADARGGFGLSVEETHKRLRLLERFITVLREPESAYAKWKSLVLMHKVAGRQVHDARLAALMKAYRLKRILTLNADDFKRYPGIEAVTPQSVLSRR
jgi:predicted nucleic acid-binding protein